MKFRKIVETSAYPTDLEYKEFFVDKLGIEFVSEQSRRDGFLKTEKICYSSSILN